jgi:hypothetical protein
MGDCLIEVRHNGAELEVAVTGPEQDALKERFARPIPDLPADQLDQLRLGDPDSAVVDQITRKVGEWLLKPDPAGLKLDLDLGKILRLDKADGPPTRVVFSLLEVDQPEVLARLTDVPLELLVPGKGGDPFVISRRVASLVHLLRKTGSTVMPREASAWPLRVLIVRSDPQNLGGGVPKALPLRQHILDQRPELAAHVVVDLLTSEDEAAGIALGRPTRAAIFDQLLKPYHILVYLGHGDVRQPDPESLPIGELLLESEDGSVADAVDAKKLSGLLQKTPAPSVPVVLLVGCLTATELRPGMTLERLEPRIPRWMRGNQGVAQALVNGQSGVQLVVGMRYRIENKEALFFLKAFFTSLLCGTLDRGRLDHAAIGEIEAAVQSARHGLHFLSEKIGWAAPVVYRSDRSELAFRFLSSPPVGVVPTQQQAIRASAWEALAAMPGAMRPPANPSALHAAVMKMLQDAEDELVARVKQTAALLMPQRQEVSLDLGATAAGTLAVRVPVESHGPVAVQTLRATVAVSSSSGGGAAGAATSITAVHPAPALGAAGFQLAVIGAPGADTLGLRIDSDAGGIRPLPAGTLFDVELAVPAAPQSCHTITLVDVSAMPPQAVVGVANAVIVPPP